ncbi:TRAP-type uncharacterized transport system, substrate-binding protein [Bradyrhizobium shewense]|uniref:TRAP-type uncharacterized transport system, substrate-binding protein n=2 Tax=Bradyrhizobium shewense TaxID=1761772 RepID=A0A1C3XPJ8_9BRAD|nr:TRAP-type uncharacterized transport system, substrate-binding protein [Bradyrhizobium shewense]
MGSLQSERRKLAVAEPEGNDMNKAPKSRSLLQLTWLVPVAMMLQTACLESQTARNAKADAQFDQRPLPKESEKDRMNAWTVGLAGGLLEGAPIRLAAEMARVVDDGADLHLLPIVTRGATDNLNALLYLRGVDTAIINSDAFEEYKIQAPQIKSRITYLLNLFPSELHIFVRPEITSLQDLVGKKVNFNTLGTAAAYSGPLIFSRLGLDVEKTFIPHQVALEQMRKGEMSAVVFITSKPVDAFVKGRWEAGFKFLPIGYDKKFEDYYLPATLDANEYPNLIKQGERISTIAVPTALVAFNWSPGSNRYQRVARLVEYLFSRIDRLQAPGFDPKWQSINLAASVPGLTRFQAAQEWLDRKARSVQARP